MGKGALSLLWRALLLVPFLIPGIASAHSALLEAAPSSGTAPLEKVDLTAHTQGEQEGSVLYKFDCGNDGAFEFVSGRTTLEQFSVIDLCSYQHPGTYTAAVQAQHDHTAEATTSITVTAPSGEAPSREEPLPDEVPDEEPADEEPLDEEEPEDGEAGDGVPPGPLPGPVGPFGPLFPRPEPEREPEPPGDFALQKLLFHPEFGGGLWKTHVPAHPGDTLRVRLELTGIEGTTEDILLVDVLPSGPLYADNLAVSGAEITGNLQDGFRVSRLGEGETAFVEFDVLVLDEFPFGATEVFNAAAASSDATVRIATANIVVIRLAPPVQVPEAEEEEPVPDLLEDAELRISVAPAFAALVEGELRAGPGQVTFLLDCDTEQAPAWNREWEQEAGEFEASCFYANPGTYTILVRAEAAEQALEESVQVTVGVLAPAEGERLDLNTGLLVLVAILLGTNLILLLLLFSRRRLQGAAA